MDHCFDLQDRFEKAISHIQLVDDEHLHFPFHKIIGRDACLADCIYNIAIILWKMYVEGKCFTNVYCCLLMKKKLKPCTSYM